jgi:hypothetical protein
MSSPKNQIQNTVLNLSAVALVDSYTDFILSKQAALCSENTVKYYQYTSGRFVQWLQS